MLGFYLADEIEKKVFKNDKRVYKNINDVNTSIANLFRLFSKSYDFVNSLNRVLSIGLFYICKININNNKM